MKLVFGLVVVILLSSCKKNIDETTNIKVYKFDNSIQCERAGIELAVMELELINAGIDVLCSQKGSDGFFRPAVCGAGTGRINIYTIHSSNINDAKDIGFFPVSELSEYRDSECQ